MSTSIMNVEQYIASLSEVEVEELLNKFKSCDTVRHTTPVQEVEEIEDSDTLDVMALSHMTCKELRAICKAQGLKNYSKAKKGVLLTMLGCDVE